MNRNRSEISREGTCAWGGGGGVNVHLFQVDSAEFDMDLEKTNNERFFCGCRVKPF